MGKNWRWLAKIFAFFGAGVGLFGIGTFTQVNSISSAVKNFFDPESSNVVFSAFGHDYTMATVVTGLILTLCVGLVVIGGIISFYGQRFGRRGNGNNGRCDAKRNRPWYFLK